MRTCFGVVLLAVILTFSGTTNAQLVDNGDGTVTQYRNDDSVLMWLKDANYAATSGYSTLGRMDWDQAIEWIDALNAMNQGVGHLGYNDWRLPENLPLNPPDYDYSFSYDGSTDHSYNITSPKSEMSYMFYVELENEGSYAPDGTYQPSGGLSNTGPFQNLITGTVYHSSDFPGSPDHSWYFSFQDGRQGEDAKSHFRYAWAVRDSEPAPIQPGDVNGDRVVTLTDAMLACQASCGTMMDSGSLTLEADVDKDGKIGLVEVIYILGQITLVEPSYFVYVPNVYDANVSVIDTVTNTVIETIAVPYLNGAVAALASSTRVYVVGSSLSVIDTLTNTVVENMAEFYSGLLTLNPEGTYLYITRTAGSSNNRQEVVVIDTATNKVEASTGPITADPQSDSSQIIDVVVGPSGRYVYVDGTDLTIVSTEPYEYEWSGFIAVIDTESNTVIKILPFAWTPERMAVHPSGDFLYVLYANLDLQNRFMAVINTATDEIVENVDLEYRPIQYLVVHPKGTYVYGSQPSLHNSKWVPGEVVPIDTTTYELKPAIEVGIQPNGLSVNPSGTRVYVVNEAQTQDNGSVSVIDTSTNAVIATVPMGKSPKAVSHGFIAKGP